LKIGQLSFAFCIQIEQQMPELGRVFQPWFVYGCGPALENFPPWDTHTFGLPVCLVFSPIDNRATALSLFEIQE